VRRHRDHAPRIGTTRPRSGLITWTAEKTQGTLLNSYVGSLSEATSRPRAKDRDYKAAVTSDNLDCREERSASGGDVAALTSPPPAQGTLLDSFVAATRTGVLGRRRPLCGGFREPSAGVPE
jgi:hypothetical protein